MGFISVDQDQVVLTATASTMTPFIALITNAETDFPDYLDSRLNTITQYTKQEHKSKVFADVYIGRFVTLN